MTDVRRQAPLVPEDAVLLHIGPYKTGSTAIQSALWARREELGQHGVAYPGNWRRLFGIGHALLQWAPRGHDVPDVAKWDDFAASVREMEDVRVCLSTEDFGRIRKPEKAAKVVADLGADRLHVVYVARAYHRLLPSHWQERVKSHITMPYEEWLSLVLGDDDEVEVRRSFHTSHDVRWMTSMWLPHLPPERITVVVTDDSDRGLLTRTFEEMLGLPAGFLTLDDASNASLSFQATEMLRRLNAVFEERGWTDRAYTQLVQRGLVRALQEAGRAPGETSIPPLPAWAHDAVRRLSEERVATLRETGVQVVGDPDVLLPPQDTEAPEHVPEVEQVALGTAATAVAGVVEQALAGQAAADERLRKARARAKRPAGTPAEDRVADTPSRALLREVVRRQRSRFGRS